MGLRLFLSQFLSLQSPVGGVGVGVGMRVCVYLLSRNTDARMRSNVLGSICVGACCVCVCVCVCVQAPLSLVLHDTQHQDCDLGER